MLRHLCGNLVLLGDRRFHQPRSTSPGLPGNIIFDKATQHQLRERLPITSDMILIQQSLLIRPIRNLDQIPGICRGLDGAVRVQLLGKVGLVSDGAVKSAIVF